MSDIIESFETIEYDGEISLPQSEGSLKSSWSLSENKQPLQNSKIIMLLQEVLEGQKTISTKIDKFEETLKKLQVNQITLSKGQATLNANQKRIAKKLEKIEAIMVTNSEMAVQSKLLTECKVETNTIQNSLRYMIAESVDTVFDEIASLLPLRTIEAVEEVEGKLDSSDFVQAMTCYIYKLKGVSEDVDGTIRAIFTDDLLVKYNWDGRWEKLPLGSLMIFNKVIRNAFETLGALEFEKRVKKSVERSHHRSKQKKYMQSRK